MTKEIQNTFFLPKEMDIKEIANEFHFWKHTLMFELLGKMAEQDDEISDEVYSYIINPPPIYAAEQSDGMKKIINENTKRYVENHKPALKVVALVKKEFYEFICTEKAYYKKQRNLLKGGATSMITGISAIIATKLTSIGIEIATITALVSGFFIVLSKMGMSVFCEIVKPDLLAKPLKAKKIPVKKKSIPKVVRKKK